MSSRNHVLRRLREGVLYGGLNYRDFLMVRGLINRRNKEMLQLFSLSVAGLGYLLYLLSYSFSFMRDIQALCFIDGTFAWLIYALNQRFMRRPWVSLLLSYACMEVAFVTVFQLSFISWHKYQPVTSTVVVLTVLPLLFLDRPWRMQLFVFTNAAAFLAYDFLRQTKMPDFLNVDFLNIVCFCIVEAILYYLLMSIVVRGFAEQKRNDALRQHMIENLAYIIENRDENTGGHVQRTSRFIAGFVHCIAKDRRYAHIMDEDTQRVIERAAPLHDIGKIKISDTILNKPGRLTDEEFAQMKMHTVYGARMIRETIQSEIDEDFYETAYQIALYHHERYDGHGYPRGLAGRKIPLAARIMALADVYDALVSERVYKKAFPKEKALAIIAEGRGTQFDPYLTDIFLEYVKK